MLDLVLEHILGLFLVGLCNIQYFGNQALHLFNSFLIGIFLLFDDFGNFLKKVLTNIRPSEEASLFLDVEVDEFSSWPAINPGNIVL